MIKATKIIHQNKDRIKVDFPFNQTFIALLREIEDAKWSKTHCAWHIPYTEEAFGQLKRIFPDIITESGDTTHPPGETSTPKETEIPEPNSFEVVLPKSTSILIEVIGKKIILKMPKNDSDVRFVLTLRYSKWDKEQRFWIIPNYAHNLDVIKGYFKDRISQVIVHQTIDLQVSGGGAHVGKGEVLCIKTRAGRLKILFGYNKDLPIAIKKMPFWNWDAKNKWWSIPFSDKLVAELEAIANIQGLRIRLEEEKQEEGRVARKSEYNTLNYRPCPAEYILKLKELRYSENTIKSYKSLFEELINHYPTHEIDKIDERMIVVFCQYLVIDRKVTCPDISLHK